MKLRLIWPVVLALFLPVVAMAHVGSPDVFYDGNIGKWPAHITIRMPAVVPGQAEIVAQVQSAEPVSVSFVPLFSRIAISNAPPPEIAQPVRGETNMYAGTMWLMTMGAYSIQVRIEGQDDEGVVQIPVNSVATSQLPLPRWLGGILIVLGLLLFGGAVAIVAAAAGESVVPAGEVATRTLRRKYWIAGTVTCVILALALVGGRKWWKAEERNFQTRLHDGGWPDLAASVRTDGSRRILELAIGEKDFGPQADLRLAPDHGKLLHLFLVDTAGHKSFAHIHPVREDNTKFAVTLPPLPEGQYELFCDLTLESGFSSTATNLVQLSSQPEPTNQPATNAPDPDPDDSWAVLNIPIEQDTPGKDTVCHLDDGSTVIWKAHSALAARHDAGLCFDVLDATGKPAVLEPYMGMMSHAAVMRDDGRVFAHLHPSGNFSLAAQIFFDAKLSKESGSKRNGMAMAMDPNMPMDGMNMPATTPSGFVSLPYEFPTPGNYRIWVQIKTDEKVKTAVFDTTVE